MKAKLVRGVSIGFSPTEFSYIEGGGVRFIEAEVYELSLVTIPANAQATILSIKAFDTATRAALGLTRNSGVVHLINPPGASGTTKTRRPGVVYLNP